VRSDHLGVEDLVVKFKTLTLCSYCADMTLSLLVLLLITVLFKRSLLDYYGPFTIVKGTYSFRSLFFIFFLSFFSCVPTSKIYLYFLNRLRFENEIFCGSSVGSKDPNDWKNFWPPLLGLLPRNNLTKSGLRSKISVTVCVGVCLGGRGASNLCSLLRFDAQNGPFAAL